MGNRTWIKIYCDKWLSGTVREDDPLVRGVWIDLLVLAGSGLYGDTGEIKLQNGIGLTDTQIESILSISEDLWQGAKKRLLDTQRIDISDLGAIRIINWTKYQSEYERQKPYRNQKLQPKVTQEKEKRKEKRDRYSDDPNKYVKGKYGHVVQR